MQVWAMCFCVLFILMQPSKSFRLESVQSESSASSQVKKPDAYADREQKVQRCLLEVKQNPQSAEAYYELGVAYYRQNALSGEQARSALKEALRLRPDYAEAYNALGWILLNPSLYSGLFVYKEDISDAMEAVRVFKKAVRFKPDYAEAYIGLGMAQRKQGDYDDSIAACKKAISLESDYVYYDQLSVSYTCIGEINAAIESKKEAIRLRLKGSHTTHIDIYLPIEPNDLLRNWEALGNLFNKASRYDEAIEAYKQALAINPDEPSLHHHLGLMYYAVGNKDLAYNEYIFLVNHYENANKDSGLYRHFAEDLYQRIK